MAEVLVESVVSTDIIARRRVGEVVLSYYGLDGILRNIFIYVTKSVSSHIPHVVAEFFAA